MKTITATQATLSPTPRTRNAGHPFSMLPVSTSKFCPQKPARKEMGRKMVTVRVAAVPEPTGLTISLVAGKVAALPGEHMTLAETTGASR
jgi:hypothetical protein